MASLGGEGSPQSGCADRLESGHPRRHQRTEETESACDEKEAQQVDFGSVIQNFYAVALSHFHGTSTLFLGCQKTCHCEPILTTTYMSSSILLQDCFMRKDIPLQTATCFIACGYSPCHAWMLFLLLKMCTLNRKHNYCIASTIKG